MGSPMLTMEGCVSSLTLETEPSNGSPSRSALQKKNACDVRRDTNYVKFMYRQTRFSMLPGWGIAM